MGAVSRIFANHANLVRQAVIQSTAQRPSTDIRRLSQVRAGSGRLALAGPYTGAVDREIEVEVVDAAGTLRASAPVISGVGNGALEVTAIAPGAVSERVTFTMLDVGSDAKAATLEFFGVTLAARATGAGGNAITVEVDRSGLVVTDLPVSTLAAIPAGTTSLDGPQWDFGQPPATDSGVPTSALRLQFAGFPQVHRSWKTWESGRWLYKLDPAPAWEIPVNTLVRSVTGSYGVTITDGVTPEVYTAITVYELLQQIQGRSALVEVRGVVAADTAPGGQAVTDIPLRTDAHALPVQVITGGRSVQTLRDVAVIDPAAATENITVTSIGRGSSGLVFEVSGSVSGSMPPAIAGQSYESGPIAFSIPSLPVSAIGASGAQIKGVFTPASREPEEPIPAVCFRPLTLGALAKDRQVTFTYRKRPDTACSCSGISDLLLSAACLGLEEGSLGTTDPAYTSRVSLMLAWRKAFIYANTSEAPEDYWTVTVTFDVGGVPTVGVCDELFGTEASAIAFSGSFAQGALYSMVGAGAGGSCMVNGKMFTFAAGIAGGSYNVTSAVIGSGTRTEKSFRAIQVEIDFAEQALGLLMGALAEVYAHSGALALWDAFWIEVQGDFDALDDAYGLDTYAIDPGYLARYRAQLDVIRMEAGILPKSDASSSGGGCWRDDQDAAYWWVDESGEYLPAFTGAAYYSVVLNNDGVPEGTQEFGMAVQTACESSLKDGDKITITIRGAASRDWQIGDQFTIPVVGAAAAQFGGGAAGDPIQTWSVTGSVSGALADFDYDNTAPAPYSDGPITATLTPGGIPWQAGDRITVDLERGTVRWRDVGGIWTTVDLFDPLALDLGDGLTLMATTGAAPSFVAGDNWRFKAVATHGTDRLRQPKVGRGYAWDGAAVEIDLDLGAVSPIEVVLLALHTLSDGAALVVEGCDTPIDLADPGAVWAVVPAWSVGPIVARPGDGTTARYLRVTVSGAGDGASIGWLWAGVPWAPTIDASEITQVRQYALARGGGLNARAIYRGRGTGGRWRWTASDGAALYGADLDGLLALVDHVAEQGAEPVVVQPDYRTPAGAALAILDLDALEVADWFEFQEPTQLAASVELPFKAVLL